MVLFFGCHAMCGFVTTETVSASMPLHPNSSCQGTITLTCSPSTHSWSLECVGSLEYETSSLVQKHAHLSAVFLSPGKLTYPQRA